MAGKYAAPSAIIDALDRAWRTFYVAIGLDAFIAISVGLSSILASNPDVLSPAFWNLLLILVVKSVLASTVAYFLRLKKAPKQDSSTDITVVAPAESTVTVDVSPVESAPEPVKQEEQVSFIG